MTTEICCDSDKHKDCVDRFCFARLQFWWFKGSRKLSFISFIAFNDVLGGKKKDENWDVSMTDTACVFVLFFLPPILKKCQSFQLHVLFFLSPDQVFRAGRAVLFLKLL